MSSLLKLLISGPTVPPQHKRCVRPHFLDHQLTLLLQNAATAFDGHLENIQKYLFILGHRPAHDHF
jgi:hypothetical protein